MERSRTYFVSDVHLGLQAFDPEDRERRFVRFLKGINTPQTQALYLLGDIWDFWYEWKEVVPKGYIRVLSALTDLIDAGVKVYFFPGNHDIWAYSYFRELGMICMDQPAFIEVDGKKLCVGHGDGLGDVGAGYRIMNSIFKCPLMQVLFSSLIHPTLSMMLGHSWSKGNRLARGEKYVWKGEKEPLFRWCENTLSEHEVDLFVFGHYHVSVDQKVGESSRLVILDSWIDGDSFFTLG